MTQLALNMSNVTMDFCQKCQTYNQNYNRFILKHVFWTMFPHIHVLFNCSEFTHTICFHLKCLLDKIMVHVFWHLDVGRQDEIIFYFVYLVLKRMNNIWRVVKVIELDLMPVSTYSLFCSSIWHFIAKILHSGDRKYSVFRITFHSMWF